MISLVVIALLAAQDATPPPAAPATGSRQIVVVGQPPATADRIICRTISETGSHLGGTRVCHRQSEWEQERRRNQLDADHETSGTQDYGYQSAPRQPGPAGSPQ